MKKVICCVLSLLMVLTLSACNSVNQAIDKVEFQTDNQTTYEAKIQSDIVYQSDVMNTEQFLNRLSMDMLFNSEEAISLVSEQTNLDIDSDNVGEKQATFRVFSQTIEVSEDYSTNVHVYCQTQEGESVEILNVISANMFPTDRADNKAFGGGIFVNIEDNDTIYYKVNGDFYKEGRHIEVEVSPSSDKMLSVSFSLDPNKLDLSEWDKLAYVYLEGRINIEGGQLYK